MNTELSQTRWFKSSHSSGGQECVEVAFIPGAVGVRDSKDPAGPALVFEPAAWDDFTSGVRAGKFDGYAPPGNPCSAA
ncbi:DUF397 domain-containing protein [Nocardia crassostreae]|uniref:DUF397 domain-containing protein n=1 Tax=Nocardia crassostreae TaxID=53428 RepID=UPI000837590D|nr:DUF397 domain-containing protein [Nocardia crassostreae]